MSVPWHAFDDEQADPASLRLSFAAPGLNHIDEGLWHLGRALAAG
ncbi:hypothetical protein [Pseudomonas massiliensis]|nr:hypothetical protein [Pseudomonas massiliensis]